MWEAEKSLKMVYLGTSITAGNRNSVDLEDRNGGGGNANGHHSDHLARSASDRDRDGNESSGDEEREGQIRVGKDYQANTPNWIPLEREY